MNFVSSIEILQMCDIRPIKDIKSNIDYYSSFINFPITHVAGYMGYNRPFSSVKSGESIYINYKSLINFFLHIFPLIDKPFILVTGFSTRTIGYLSKMTPSIIINLVSQPKIINWYVQNLGIIHPKIKCIPLGLDLHSRPIPSQIQQEPLNSLPRKHFSERKIKIYSTFHFKTEYGNDLGHPWGNERKIALRYIPNKLIYYEPYKIERLQSWIKQIDFAFVASPYGAGMDCHRTWEALVLGCIPIIRVIPPMKPLFDDLPVLIIEKWSDINLKLLEDTVSQFKNKIFNYDKLTLNYWKILFS